MPCEGGEAVMPANEIRLNNIAGQVSTTNLKNLCHVGKSRQRPKTQDFLNFLLSCQSGTWLSRRRVAKGFETGPLFRHEPAPFLRVIWRVRLCVAVVSLWRSGAEISRSTDDIGMLAGCS